VSSTFDLHSVAVFDSHIRAIHTYHAMVSVNQTRPHCVNQIGKNMAGERHGMCESALRLPDSVTSALEGGRLSAIRTGRLYPQKYPGTNF
jgi:hypothetical protein